MIVNKVYISLFFLSTIFFASKRLLRYLRFLQQEEYQPKRFLLWILNKKAFDKKGSVLLLLCSLLYVTAKDTINIVLLLCSILLIIVAAYEENPLKVGKLTLKFTARAKRIFSLAVVLYIAQAIIILLANHALPLQLLLNIISFQCIPLFLILSVLILQPIEKHIQRKFLSEAEKIFRNIKPYTIAITGSYGKTSTKLILTRLLNASLAATFSPEKGINTLMGITREIRNKLNSDHKYAVIEMGAYSEGSIKRLCNLTPPKACIVTAVGLMHLERFGSKEQIYRAKSELPQAVPTEGILVCNGDNEGARQIAVEFAKTITLLYGLNKEFGKLDCWASDIIYELKGTSFCLHWLNKEYRVSTPLHGRAALSNILAAFTMSCALGASPEYLCSIIALLEPIKNRLEVVSPGNYVQINDAYNSNPQGFSDALEVLGKLPGQRRFLITPGMIELGDRQEYENFEIAKQAAKICDKVFIVGSTNSDAILSGLSEGGMRAENILLYEHRDLALKEFQQQHADGDIVLIENDLPDLYEMDVRF